MNIASTQPIEAAAVPFSENLMTVARKCIPVKTITVRQKDAPWFTEKLLELKGKKIKSGHQREKPLKFRPPMAIISSSSKLIYTDEIRKR